MNDAVLYPFQADNNCIQIVIGKPEFIAKISQRRLDPCCAVFKYAGAVEGQVIASWAVIHTAADGAVAVWCLKLERGRLPRCGLWEFEAQPHALERWFQRSPSCDLTAALVEANDAVRAGRVYQHADGTQTLIPGRPRRLSRASAGAAPRRAVRVGENWLSYGMQVRDDLVVAPPLRLPATA